MHPQDGGETVRERLRALLDRGAYGFGGGFYGGASRAKALGEDAQGGMFDDDGFARQRGEEDGEGEGEQWEEVVDDPEVRM